MSELCTLVRELLPLYAEGCCGGESEKIIRAHLAECPGCRAALEEIKAEAKQGGTAAPQLSPKAPLKKLKHYYELRTTKFVVPIVLALVLLAVPTFGSIFGIGYSWASPGAYFSARRAAAAIVAQDPQVLDETMYFRTDYGFSNGSEVALRLAALPKSGITIKAANAYFPAAQEQNHNTGARLTLTVEYGGQTYRVPVNGFAMPGGLQLVEITQLELLDTATGSYTRVKDAPGWVEQISEAICNVPIRDDLF